MAAINVIGQRDACARALQSFLHVDTPPRKLNVTGEKVEVRRIAEKFGAVFGRPPVFSGNSQPSAWHIDPAESLRLFGPPLTSLDAMIAAVAGYLQAGGRLLGKPTHFEVRDGKF